MHGSEQNGYGLWMLVILNTAIFVIFAFSFTKPKTKRDWRSLGAFSAFILALFTEMYGFPLTIYLLSGWLGQKFPGLNLLTHDAGHIWSAFLGSDINPHFHPIHIAANIFIVLGFWILASAWKILHPAQQNHQLATSGIYSKVRHPQYIGFVAIMFGFLLMWPTLLTLIMFPILLYMYYRLSIREEKDMRLNLAKSIANIKIGLPVLSLSSRRYSVKNKIPQNSRTLSKRLTIPIHGLACGGGGSLSLEKDLGKLKGG